MMLKQKSIISGTAPSGAAHLLIEAENFWWLANELDTTQFHLKGAVDTCYIDPPYNTGNTTATGFTYHDNQTRDEWLGFMRKRLEFINRLLKSTGVIVVSIDDNEVHHLRVLMDKVFGEENFIAQLTVDGGANKNNANFFSTTHEYMLVYSKNLAALNKTKTKWRKKREGVELMLKEYDKQVKLNKTPTEISQHMKKWVKTQQLPSRLKKFVNADENGLYTAADLSVPGNRYIYTVLHPVTGKPVTEPSRGWGLNEEKFQKLVEQNQIIWGLNEKLQPLKKFYLKDKKDQLMKTVLSYPSRSSSSLLIKLLGKRDSFNNAKNLQLMKDVLDYVTPEDGVVLDCFAGTGTTGQAVFELNKENSSSRQVILVTKNENNIFFETTLPRLEKVLETTPQEQDFEVWVTEHANSSKP